MLWARTTGSRSVPGGTDELATPSLAVLAVGVAVSLPAVADAASPGRNARIAFEHQQAFYGFGRGDSEISQIWSVLPNGTRPRTLLASGRGSFAQSAYSPDGRKL